MKVSLKNFTTSRKLGLWGQIEKEERGQDGGRGQPAGTQVSTVLWAVLYDPQGSLYKAEPQERTEARATETKHVGENGCERDSTCKEKKKPQTLSAMAPTGARDNTRA